MKRPRANTGPLSGLRDSLAHRGSPVFLPLQAAGILSVVIFLIRCGLEIFVAHGLYESQHVLISLLDVTLSIWALAEIAIIDRKVTPIPLRGLTGALVGQVAVGVIRALVIFVTLFPRSAVDVLTNRVDFGLAAVFIPVAGIVFLAISKLLIDAFSHAERVRGDQLEMQVARTLKAEAELRARQDELRRIFDNLPIAIAATTPETDGRILFLNAHFVRTFGYSHAEIPTTAEWVVRAYPDPAQRQAVLSRWNDAVSRAIRAHGTASSLEFQVTCKDGTVREMLFSALALPDLLLVAMLDDTARTHAEKEVAAARRRVQIAEARQRRLLKRKLKSSLMASAVAHEINLPLSTILLRTQLALKNGDGGQETLTAVAADAQQVVRTIEKMKVLLRSVQTEHSTVDLTAVVRTSFLRLKWQLNQQGIVLECSGLDDPCLIDGDDAQLQLAVTNGLRNAIEAIAATEAGTGRIAVSLLRKKLSVILAIGDSGPGWSGAERAVDPLSTTKPSGSGIGLYVVRAALRNHRGRIAFRRSPLGGAELRLRFPRKGDAE
ncbi:MAG: PAS domain-containing sensor histidine kinase [Planctomycetia bacterium]|nr:PAS domain-containing sensor histidine kinase [Planctomycetia bacterium]